MIGVVRMDMSAPEVPRACRLELLLVHALEDWLALAFSFSVFICVADQTQEQQVLLSQIQVEQQQW